MRTFVYAMAVRDEPTLRAITLPVEGFEWLMAGQAAPASVIKELEEKLAQQTFRSLKAGDKFTLPQGQVVVVQAEDVGPDRALLLPEGASLPTRLRKVEGHWKVDPSAVIAGRKADEAARRKAEPKNSGERDDRRGLIAPEAVRTDRGTAASQPRGSAQTTSPAPAHRVRGRGPMPRGKLSQDLGRLDPAGPRYATDVVEHVLAQARAAEASDVHLHPGADGLEVRWRIDGVLQPVAVLPSRLAANVVARLKVLVELLTYRTDVPQEGRIRGAPGEVEMRLSTFPTLHGEKAVVRLFAGSGRFLRLGDLGLPAEVHDALAQVLEETSGAGILSGPAGSGKTTSLYACLRELAARSWGERRPGHQDSRDRRGLAIHVLG